MDQRAQKERLLEMAGLNECSGQGAKTPIPKGMVLERCNEEITTEDEEALRGFEYRTKVGKIGYLVVGTDPSLAYAFAQEARHGHSPRIIHKNAVTQTLKHIRRNLDTKLVYI